jgi:hypothetical protein
MNDSALAFVCEAQLELAADTDPAVVGLPLRSGCVVTGSSRGRAARLTIITWSPRAAALGFGRFSSRTRKMGLRS